jgi:hypothetical protein
MLTATQWNMAYNRHMKNVDMQDFVAGKYLIETGICQSVHIYG